MTRPRARSYGLALRIGLAAFAAVGLVACSTSRQEADEISVAAPAAATAPDPVPTDAQIGAAMMAQHRDALENTRRPKLDIAFEPLAQDDVLVSKLGGSPYLPAGASIPRGKDGSPLHLLVQFDFGDLPPLQGYPKDGLLQIFIAAGDFYGANFDGSVDMAALSRQQDFRVVYWPAPLKPALPATSPLALGEHEVLPFDPSKPRRMRFTAGSETVSRDDVHFQRVIGQGADALVETYAARNRLDSNRVYEALADAAAAPGNKLGGYPFFTQTDPRTPDDPQVLLLQLDSDPDADMMWGDSGVANFFIRPDDLARADFSRVAYNWDCF